MREGDDDALSGANERRKLVLRFGQAAGDEGRPLRLEGERLSRGKRVEECSFAERHRLEALFLPDRPDLAGLPHEIGTARDGPHQIARDRSRRTVVAEGRLYEIQEALDRRIDDRRFDGMQCALRERRKGTHLLDLVSPELDAKRFPPRRREDVDEAAPDRELPALVGTLDSFVARQGKRLGELFEADLLPGCNAKRLRPRSRRRHRLCERRGRSCDEPARGEDVERARPLADEVWRWIEAGAPVDTAARQHRNAFVTEEPRGAFGGVARVLILRSEQNERAAELLVQRSEQKRQRRLGNAARSRERLGVAFEAFGRAELRYERVQDRVVHHKRPNPAGSALVMVPPHGWSTRLEARAGSASTESGFRPPDR